MEQENGGNTLTPPPPEVSSSVKRKRGRPRIERSEKRAKKSRTAEPTAVSNNDGVGQEVTGVVNAAFDAGYLITVRIGNAGTVYSGVVFKPGNYIPLSSEIDVAPNVQMIRRNEILTERNHHRGRRPKQRYGDDNDDESVPVTVRDYGGDLRNGEATKGKEAYNNDNVDSVVVGGGKSEETNDDDDDDNSDTVSAEPLQIVHSDSISSRSSNMGRMSELLQVLQRENEEGDDDNEMKKKK